MRKAGRLDVTEGTIETVSGKLIITTNFVGTITTTGGEIEFQPDPGVEQIFTNIALNGGYFSIPQSEYTLDSVTWISGGFSGTSANTLTVNNLSFQSGANKQLSNINVVVNTIIIGGNGDDMIFSGSGSTFTFVGDMTIPRVRQSMDQYISIYSPSNTIFWLIKALFVSSSKNF
jgi:hypothetical protein